jgi:hypothetical protein
MADSLGSAESHFAALFKLYQRLIDARNAPPLPGRPSLAESAASA